MLKENLLNKEKIGKDLIVGDGNSNGQGVGLFARGRSKEKGSNGDRQKFRLKSRNKNLTHNYCKKKWHTQSECYKLLNK